MSRGRSPTTVCSTWATPRGVRSVRYGENFILPGFFDSSCGHCVWHDHTRRCPIRNPQMAREPVVQEIEDEEEEDSDEVD